MTAMTVSGNDDAVQPANSLPERVARYLGPTFHDQTIKLTMIALRFLIVLTIVTHLAGVHVTDYQFAIRAFEGFGSITGGLIKLSEFSDVCGKDNRRARRALLSSLVWFGGLAYAILQ